MVSGENNKYGTYEANESVKNGRKSSRKLEEMETASGAEEKDEATQCAIFLHTIGEEALEVYDTFTFTETEQDKIEPLIQKFEGYCTPRKNTTYERYVFNTCIQNGRTLDAFYSTFAIKQRPVNSGLYRTA